MSAPDFVLLGATGFIGSHILAALEAQELRVSVPPRSLRLQQRDALKEYLEANHPTVGVICAAGSRGSPNIDWCLANPAETVDINLTGQLNVAGVCFELKLHCTLIGSGLVYPGLSKEREESGDWWSEERDKLRGSDYVDGLENCTKTFEVKISDSKTITEPVHIYRKLRCQLEDLLKYFPNVLNLRVLFPVSMSDTRFEDKRSLLAKLRGFALVDPAFASVTFLEDLCPGIAVLARKGVVGDLNFVNPGGVRYESIVERFRKLKELRKGEFKFEGEVGPSSGGRGNVLMSSDKLVESLEGKVRTSEKCLDEIFGNLET